MLPKPVIETDHVVVPEVAGEGPVAVGRLPRDPVARVRAGAAARRRRCSARGAEGHVEAARDGEEERWQWLSD